MKHEIVSQYKASLKMLQNVVESCPINLWSETNSGNSFWRIAYHSIFYIHLYLHKSEKDFHSWYKHKTPYQFLGDFTRDKQPIIIKEIYYPEDVLEIISIVFNSLEKFIEEDSMENESGFSWLKMSRMELHIYNIRHCQHHIGQLVEKLHLAGVNNIKWEGIG